MYELKEGAGQNIHIYQGAARYKEFRETLAQGGFCWLACCAMAYSEFTGKEPHPCFDQLIETIYVGRILGVDLKEDLSASLLERDFAAKVGETELAKSANMRVEVARYLLASLMNKNFFRFLGETQKQGLSIEEILFGGEIIDIERGGLSFWIFSREYLDIINSFLEESGFPLIFDVVKLPSPKIGKQQLDNFVRDNLIEILRIGSKKLVLLPIEIYKNERYLTGHYILVTSLSKAGLLTVHDPNEHDSVVVPLRKFFPSNVGGITVDRVNKIKYKVRFDVGIITLGYRGPGGRRE